MTAVGGSRPFWPMTICSTVAAPSLAMLGLVSCVIVRLRLSFPGRNSLTVAVIRSRSPLATPAGADPVKTKMPSDVRTSPSEAPAALWT
jgi:hypothetical protein